MGETRASTGAVGKTTRLSVNGSTSLVVTPPLPCGLAECVAELHVTGKHGDTNRVHLSARQRRELVVALGGVAPITLPGGLPDDALPNGYEPCERPSCTKPRRWTEVDGWRHQDGSAAWGDHP